MVKAISNQSTSLKGACVVPGDKSISHRALMLGAIASGETKIKGLLESEDIKATRSALAKCGAVFYMDQDGEWRIKGFGEEGAKDPDTPLNLGNSGTSARLLMGLLTGLGVRCTLLGDASLQKRPMRRVLEPLREMGATFDTGDSETLPLLLTTVNRLNDITYELPIASAQVKSCVLLAGLNSIIAPSLPSIP